MPRKGFSNFDDYDDGFDDGDAYDDDYDDDEHGKHLPHSQLVSLCCCGLIDLFCMNSAEEAEHKEVEIAWRCGICTYDNDESMNACDICGAIRHPVAGGNQTINNNTGTVSSILKILY